jgi:hypothetical protein
MSDYKKINLIHNLPSTFKIDKRTLNKFKSQIEDSKKLANLDRFLKGYETEDMFFNIYSALPWIKLIHALSQEQTPQISKKEFQVPDFLVMFENSKKASIPLLVEVKGVRKECTTLSLQKIQFENLLAYAKTINTPLVFAVHWKYMQGWTIISSDVFKKNSSGYKITMERAILNDLSVIFADFTFIIPAKLQRMKEYNKKIKSGHIKHKEYGVLTGEWITWDTKNIFDIDTNESALIRSFISMNRLKVAKEKSITRTLDISSTQFLPKFTYLILRLLKLLQA